MNKIRREARRAEKLAAERAARDGEFVPENKMDGPDLTRAPAPPEVSSRSGLSDRARRVDLDVEVSPRLEAEIYDSYHDED